MQAVEQPTPVGYSAESNRMPDDSQSTATPPRRSNARACALCVKNKTKCMPHAEIEGLCQRCHRLGKNCFLHERPSRKRTRASEPTRVAKLEQKLDGLITLFTSNQSTLQVNPSGQASDGLLPRSPASLDSNASATGPSTAAPPSVNLDGGSTSVHTVNSSYLPTTLARSATDRSFLSELDDQEADIILFEFKRNMTEQFPFIVVPSDSTSQSLQHDRPLLRKAIMVAASHGDPHRQLTLGSELMEDLTKRLLFGTEKSLDLLQGLLILIAWYHYHTLVNPQITNLLHLAKALINNMGLHCTQTAYDGGKFFLDGREPTKAETLSSQGLQSDKFEGWRALAGCFYLASAISASCQALELQFNTNYILECCRKLEEAAEYRSDILLIQLVRLQEIRYRMGRSFPYDDPNVSRRPDVPVELFLKVWQKELETFWMSLPVDSQQNWLLLTTFHTVEIALYEIDIGDDPMCLPRATVKVVTRSGRLEFIHASLVATRKVFDIYSSIPVERLSGISFTLWLQFTHAILNGVKLLTSETDGWDSQYARSVLKLHDILLHQVDAMEQITSSRSVVSGNAVDGKDIFAEVLVKMHHALRWYESSRISGSEPQGLSDQHTDPNESVEVADPGEPLPVFDDAFWQNFFNDNWMLVGNGLST